MQTADGGWGDSSTTAFTLMAINALGQSPREWITESGKDPEADLLSYQKANGAFVYNWEFTDDNIMSTAGALLAVFDSSYLLDQNISETAPQAVVFVDPGMGSFYADCVEFEESTIDGMELLERSDFTYEIQEGFLNSIMGVANPEGETNYWSYWSWNGREWVFQNNGAGDSTVLPGSLEAWYFTSWETFPSFPPDFIPDMGQICGVELLKNYTSQPHLDYNDLYDVIMQEVQPPMIDQGEPEENMTAAPTGTSDAPATKNIEPSSRVDPSSSSDEEPPQSSLPVVIIAGVGGLVLIVVSVILFKKRK
jgi:hypothetical protein